MTGTRADPVKGMRCSSIDLAPMAADDVFKELLARLDTGLVAAADGIEPVLPCSGRLLHAAGTVLRASGLRAQVGEICRLHDRFSGRELQAEVVGFEDRIALLAPMGTLDGLSPSTAVHPSGQPHTVVTGDLALGRVLDGMGEPMPNGGLAWPLQAERRPVTRAAPAALSRRNIAEVFGTGIRPIDALLTCGVGQRMGIFAPAGAGKSTLLAMLCRNARADVVVAALVGERGREVADFIRDALPEGANKRAVVVAATSDRPAAERLKAAFVATAHAEHFAGQGLRVLLLIDSVTRLARAAREIGLAAGEPAVRRGFPPSVFALLPQLFERAGRFATGSITAFYTVLEETDDGADPVSEEVRSLVDGHIVLSRKLAERGHFPAIDLLSSVSRLADRIITPTHAAASNRLRAMLAKHADIEILLRIGEFRRGVDALADLAVDRREHMDTFLRQRPDLAVDFSSAIADLRTLTEEGPTP